MGGGVVLGRNGGTGDLGEEYVLLGFHFRAELNGPPCPGDDELRGISTDIFHFWFRPLEYALANMDADCT